MKDKDFYGIFILKSELLIDLLVAKSPDGNPFIGCIQGETWFFRVIESNLISILSPKLVKRHSVKNKLWTIIKYSKFGVPPRPIIPRPCQPFLILSRQ